MASLLDGIETGQVGAAKKPERSSEGLSNTAKIAIAFAALGIAIAILVWQFSGADGSQTQLTAAEQEASAQLAKEDAARKAPRQPGQAAPPPVFVPITNETYNRR